MPSTRGGKGATTIESAEARKSGSAEVEAFPSDFLRYRLPLSVRNERRAMNIPTRKTKIIATLGPASASDAVIERLILAGVDVFRLNFSHGSNDMKREIIGTVRRLSAAAGRQIGILADLQGPKIRTGRMEGGALPLAKGDLLDITINDVLGKRGLISTVYQALPHDVRPGSRILMDDGLIELKVQSISGTTVHCTVVEGGILKDLKGINLPGVDVSSPSLTDKDRQDLEFCLEMGVDFIALSFVRQSEDVDELKRLIFERGLDTPVVAKIEKPEALRNFAAILKSADAVMLSGETASGQFPVEAVRTMVKIALDVERSELKRAAVRQENHNGNISEAVAEAACNAAFTLKAKAVVVFTQSGSTARLISKYRPPLPIIAFSSVAETRRRLALSWGVHAWPIGSVGGTDQQIAVVEQMLLGAGLKKGDLVVITIGVPVEARGSTNLMKVHKLGTGVFYEIF